MRLDRDAQNNFVVGEDSDHEAVCARQSPVVTPATLAKPQTRLVDSKRRREDRVGLSDRIEAQARTRRLEQTKRRWHQISCAGVLGPIEIHVRQRDRQEHATTRRNQRVEQRQRRYLTAGTNKRCECLPRQLFRMGGKQQRPTSQVAFRPSGSSSSNLATKCLLVDH
jgi:hypothetical protein